MIKPAKNNLALVLLPAIILRLVFSSLFFHPDIKKFHYQVQFFRSGVINVYEYINLHKDTLPNTDTFNYPSGLYFLLGAYNGLAQVLLGPGFTAWLNDWGPNAYSHPRMYEFMLVLKLPYIFLDILILVLLLKINKSPITNHQLTILWLFNPVSLYAIYMLGQVDVICAALTVGALLSTQKKKLSWAALFLGLGAAIKTYPLLLLPFILIRSQTMKQFINLSLISLFGLLIPLLPVINSPAFRSTMTQSNLTQYIFYAGLPVSGSQQIPLFVLVWGITFWISYNRRKNYNILPELFTVTLSVILFSHFHAQWIVWSLPFLALIIAQNIKLLPIVTLLVVGYFGTVFLIPDQYVFFGLFSSINPQVVFIPPLAEFVSRIFDPNFIQSIFHTLLAASGIWLIISAWMYYEKN